MKRVDQEKRVLAIINDLSKLDTELMKLEDLGEYYQTGKQKKRIAELSAKIDKLTKSGVKLVVRLGYAKSEDGLTSDEVDQIPEGVCFRNEVALWRLGNGEWC